MGITLSISVGLPVLAIVIIIPLLLISWLTIIGAPFIFFTILPLASTGISIVNVGLLGNGISVSNRSKITGEKKDTSAFGTVQHVVPENARKGIVIRDGENNIILTSPEPVKNIYNDLMLLDEDGKMDKIEQIFKEVLNSSYEGDCTTTEIIDYKKKEESNYEKIKLNNSTLTNIKNNIIGKTYFKLHLGNKPSTWNIRNHLQKCPLCQSQIEILRRVIPPMKNNSWWEKIPRKVKKILTTYFDFPWDKINKVLFSKEELEEREKIFEEKSNDFNFADNIKNNYFYDGRNYNSFG